MDNPCYNRETKKDCPDRHMGCAITCPKWMEFEEAKAIEYAKRKAIADAANADISARQKVHKNYMRKYLNDRQRKRQR